MGDLSPLTLRRDPPAFASPPSLTTAAGNQEAARGAYRPACPGTALSGVPLCVCERAGGEEEEEKGGEEAAAAVLAASFTSQAGGRKLSHKMSYYRPSLCPYTPSHSGTFTMDCHCFTNNTSPYLGKTYTRCQAGSASISIPSFLSNLQCRKQHVQVQMASPIGYQQLPLHLFQNSMLSEPSATFHKVSPLLVLPLSR